MCPCSQRMLTSAHCSPRSTGQRHMFNPQRVDMDPFDIPWWIDCALGDLILPGLLGIMMGPIGLGNLSTGIGVLLMVRMMIIIINSPKVKTLVFCWVHPDLSLTKYPPPFPGGQFTSDVCWLYHHSPSHLLLKSVWLVQTWFWGARFSDQAIYMYSNPPKKDRPK